MTLDKLCENLPKEFSEYINITRNIPFEDKPDYK